MPRRLEIFLKVQIARELRIARRLVSVELHHNRLMIFCAAVPGSIKNGKLNRVMDTAIRVGKKMKAGGVRICFYARNDTTIREVFEADLSEDEAPKG